MAPEGAKAALHQQRLKKQLTKIRYGSAATSAAGTVWLRLDLPSKMIAFSQFPNGKDFGLQLGDARARGGIRLLLPGAVLGGLEPPAALDIQEQVVDRGREKAGYGEGLLPRS